jgi:hypothetical protein
MVKKYSLAAGHRGAAHPAAQLMRAFLDDAELAWLAKHPVHLEELTHLALGLANSTDRAHRAAVDLLAKARSMGTSEVAAYIAANPVTDSRVLVQWALAFEATERVERGTKNLKNANQTRQEAADQAALDAVKDWNKSKTQPTAETVKRYLRAGPPDRRARRLRAMLKTGRVK